MVVSNSGCDLGQAWGGVGAFDCDPLRSLLITLCTTETTVTMIYCCSSPWILISVCISQLLFHEDTLLDHNVKEDRLNLAYSFRGFSPWIDVSKGGTS